MEPVKSHETQTLFESHTPPASNSRDRDKARIRSLALFAVAALLLGSLVWTGLEWHERGSHLQATVSLSRETAWSFETASHASSRAFVRIQETSFWSSRTHGLLTSPSYLASQNAPVFVRNENKLRPSQTVTLAPHSTAFFSETAVHVTSGIAQIKTAANETRVLSPHGTFPAMRPEVGTIHDLQNSKHLVFSLSQLTSGAPTDQAVIEFARDPEFHSVLFSVPAEMNTEVDFGDRSPGAWFARIVDQPTSEPKVIGMTSFNIVESLAPDQLRRLGRRWFTWRDRGLASEYRIEFLVQDQVAHSWQQRGRELDLSKVQPQIPAGRHLVRVVAIAADNTETASRPFSLDIQEKSEMFQTELHLADPELKMLARGWRVLLNQGEARRIREGYVILRESELRGIKVDSALQSQDVLRSLIFEVSRDESFSNPERVRPDIHGELLPPALPLGTLHVRLRRLDQSGEFGAFGPSSRLTTWLPAPETAAPLATQIRHEGRRFKGAELHWKQEAKVAGYELRLSPTREFKEETTKVIRTRSSKRKVASRVSDRFFWTVTAINEQGLAISLTSPIQEVSNLHPVQPKVAVPLAQTDPSETRKPAALPPIPMLQSPDEDAVIVGGATATKYGKLLWDFKGSKADGSNAKRTSFEIEIATDGDFVNIIERATTKKPEYMLEGDLPEGSLFWRVRQATSNDWSRSRRFELIYE